MDTLFNLAFVNLSFLIIKEPSPLFIIIKRVAPHSLPFSIRVLGDGAGVRRDCVSFVFFLIKKKQKAVPALALKEIRKGAGVEGSQLRLNTSQVQYVTLLLFRKGPSLVR